MAWYGVHVVLVVEFKDGNQSTYPAWDNVYLIDAQSSDEAAQKAEEIGRLNEGDADGTFCWDNRPATLITKGVRKIVEISSPTSPTNEVGDGVEITYQTLEFDDKSALEHFVQGDPVRPLIID